MKPREVDHFPVHGLVITISPMEQESRQACKQIQKRGSQPSKDSKDGLSKLSKAQHGDVARQSSFTELWSARKSFRSRRIVRLLRPRRSEATIQYE
jgi:hypothetical protein